MFLKIAGAYSAEQSGIRGVKTSFDPNINFKQPYNLHILAADTTACGMILVPTSVYLCICVL